MYYWVALRTSNIPSRICDFHVMRERRWCSSYLWLCMHACMYICICWYYNSTGDGSSRIHIYLHMYIVTHITHAQSLRGTPYKAGIGCSGGRLLGEIAGISLDLSLIRGKSRGRECNFSSSIPELFECIQCEALDQTLPLKIALIKINHRTKKEGRKLN